MAELSESQGISYAAVNSEVSTGLWGEVGDDSMDQSKSLAKGMEAVDISDNMQAVKTRMLQRVANADAHFKHQQRGDPDLTHEEKYQIANELLNRGAAMFLARFGKYLVLDDLQFFNDKSSEYEVNFYLQEIRQQCNKHFSENRIKNRRYEAMKQLINQGEYFSEDEMKYRDPYLYEQLIGQYITEEEINSKVDKSDLKFSTILLSHIDMLEENNQYAKQKEKEECQMEEEEESSEEDEEMSDEKNDTSDVEKISESRKEELRGEFYQIMQERFLAGEDENFDYSAVDYNTDYDNLDVLDKDEEEKYFDSEEPDDWQIDDDDNEDFPCNPSAASRSNPNLRADKQELSEIQPSALIETDIT